MKGFHTKSKVVREEVIASIAKLACTTLIDPAGDLDYLELKESSVQLVSDLQLAKL